MASRGDPLPRLCAVQDAYPSGGDRRYEGRSRSWRLAAATRGRLSGRRVVLAAHFLIAAASVREKSKHV